MEKETYQSGTLDGDGLADMLKFIEEGGDKREAAERWMGGDEDDVEMFWEQLCKPRVRVGRDGEVRGVWREVG